MKFLSALALLFSTAALAVAILAVVVGNRVDRMDALQGSMERLDSLEVAFKGMRKDQLHGLLLICTALEIDCSSPKP